MTKRFLAWFAVAALLVFGCTHAQLVDKHGQPMHPVGTLIANCTNASGDVELGCISKSARTVFGAVVDNAGGITISHTTGDMDLNNHVVHTAGAGTATTDLASVGQLNVIPVDVVTTSALPTYTYSNGSTGVGATITVTANGACPTIDGISGYTYLLVQNGAAFTDNGPYKVSNAGGVSTQCMFTRDVRADSATEIRSSTIRVTQGTARRGAVYEYVNDPSISIGTTALAWKRVDMDRGVNEVSVVRDDFVTAMSSTATCANNTVMNTPLAAFCSISGTASINYQALAGTATEAGMLRFSTTTSTAAATISWAATHPPIVISSDQYFRMRIRLAGPSQLSNGTDTFRWIVGLASAITNPSDGIWVENTQATDVHWFGTTRASSSSTNLISGTTVVTSTYTRADVVKYAGESKIHFYFDNVEATGSPTTSTLPLGTSLTLWGILVKSAGSTAITADLDSIEIEQAWPTGRAA